MLILTVYPLLKQDYPNSYTIHFPFYYVSILLRKQLLDHQLQYLKSYTLDMYKIPFC